MNSIKEKTIGQIVADDYRTAQVFKKFGLDFCCGGKRTVEEACEKKGVELSEVQKALDALGNKATDQHNYSEWSPAFLVDYIINTHHHFVRTKLPEIKAYARKVAKVHGNSYPVLNKMLDRFLKLNNEMLSHLDKEEQILFPYIKKLVAAESGGRPLAEKPAFGTAANPVRMMEAEHEEAGGLMAELESLSNGFTPPEDACTTFRVYFQNLEGFRDDLHKHVHLENNILFPKALELERSLN